MFDKYRNKRRMARGMEIEDSIMTATQKEKAFIESPFEKKGLSVIWYVIILVLLVLAGRVFFLDYTKGNYYAEIARNNRIRAIAIKAPRGQVLDKYGQVLATTVPSLDAIIVPSDLPKNESLRNEMADQLAGILDMNSGSIRIELNSQDLNSIDPVLLKENISQNQALIVSERASDFPGVEIDKTAIRSYNNSQIFASVIGYDGKITQKELSSHPGYLMTDYIGKTGLEESYEDALRGTYGATEVEVDSLGHVRRVIGVTNPTPGSDLVLNIDAGLQEQLYNDMTAMLQKTGTKSAAAVAIDPRTGGVLAMVNVPSYDNNLFAKGISGADYKKLTSDPDLPLLNRCIAGQYPPGSTIKPAIATAALSEGVITSSTMIDGLGGVLRVGGWSFGDWTAHAPSNVKMAIAQSNDVFF
ncbi:MAG: penicillin-binding transpeptidase domain-containing protein, partial [Candidatus Pacebacteria bacterium]|nr:penicillin-binding transpeptidase domain-containing protein [Candidatus Paceibacterota bacterium]